MAIKRLLITAIESKEVNKFPVSHRTEPEMTVDMPALGSRFYMEETFSFESVDCRRYFVSDRKNPEAPHQEIRLGATRAVLKEIGFVFDVHDESRRHLTKIHDERNKLQREVDLAEADTRFWREAYSEKSLLIHKVSWWRRVVYLFTGVLSHGE